MLKPMNAREFVREYFGQRKSVIIIAEEYGIPITTLYEHATEQWGLTLRNYSEALRVSLDEGRGPYRKPPKKVDWKKFERLYYERGLSLDDLAAELGYAHGQALGRRARKEGYKLRKPSDRKTR